MSHRKMTPKGHMSSNGSGPAIMMMPNHIRATFMPEPPLRYEPPPKKGGSSRRPALHGGKIHRQQQGVGDRVVMKRSSLTGVYDAIVQFERSAAPKRHIGRTPQSAQEARGRQRTQRNADKLAPKIAEYRESQQKGKTPGEFEGMNCFSTLFVGRLAYETTERKLLREFEAFGPVKDLKMVWELQRAADRVLSSSNNGASGEEGGVGELSRTAPPSRGESCGYAFVEFEKEDDMKRAYRVADGMKLDGRNIVVDVERGHTVPNWLPRRLGGGLGGTRLGGKDKNVTAPGRFDPSKDNPPPPQHLHNAPNQNQNPHPHHRPSYPMNGGDRRDGGPGNYHRGPPDMMRGNGPPPGGAPPGGKHGRPPYNGGYGGGPPNPYSRGGGPPPPYGGGGGGVPMDRYGPPSNSSYGGGGGGGRYGDRGPPPPMRGGGGGGYDRRYEDRRGPYPDHAGSSGGGGSSGDNRSKRHRSRSRSRSPPSSRRRYRG